MLGKGKIVFACVSSHFTPRFIRHERLIQIIAELMELSHTYREQLWRFQTDRRKNKNDIQIKSNVVTITN